MAACVIRVVLPSVVFRDDQVGREIKNEAGLVAERRFKQLVEPILLDPELPAEITLKPYGDPRNVMISR